MWAIPTTVLWTSRMLELVVLLCSVQLPSQAAVHPHTKRHSGTCPMELSSQMLVLNHTTELGLDLQEQYVSTVTPGLPQQESSAVTYLMTVETYRASMWGYILPLQVNPIHWRAACKISLIWAMRPWGARYWETCILCIDTNMSLKYHMVRPLKFHFLFVVLEVIKNDQVIKVWKKWSPKGGGNPALDTKKVTGCRLCKHCGCMLNSELTQMITCLTSYSWPWTGN